jgi:hypothetical protein
MYQENVHNRKPIEVKLKTGTYGYYNIAEQWNAMLADPETAEWGADLIIKLLDIIDHASKKDDTSLIYNSPEWKAIVNRRGPIEAAWRSKCSTCQFVNIGFGVSGFLDEYYVIDYEAMTITWRSVYEEGVVIPQHDKCSKCGQMLSKEEWISPFQAIKGFTIIRT